MRELRISEMISDRHIIADLRARTKFDALREMADLLGSGLDPGLHQAIWESLQQRELLASTGIGDQVAIPHGKLDRLPAMVAAFARSREGVEFGAIDGQPTKLFFAIVAPANSNGQHLRALARVARLCKNSAVRARLLAADQAAELHRTLAEAEQAIEASR